MGQEFSVRCVDPGSWEVVGELDLATAPLFETSLTADWREGDLRLDCARLVFMDSQGVRSMLVVASARPSGARLVLRNLTPEVRRIADLVQLGSAPGVEIEA